MATMSANEVSLSGGATVWIGINAHHERPTVTAVETPQRRLSHPAPVYEGNWPRQRERVLGPIQGIR